MRDFYKQVLKDFHLYCGNRSQMRDWDDEEISKLLDILVKVSQAYSYIPEDGQKAIIETQLIKDTEYTTLNARTVGKWFEQNGKHFFKESAHVETKTEGEIVTGEAREKWLDMFAKSVLNAQQEFTKPGDEGHKGSGTRLRENIERSTGNQKFVFDGFEIWAKTEEEARNIYETQVGKR